MQGTIKIALFKGYQDKNYFQLIIGTQIPICVYQGELSPSISVVDEVYKTIGKALETDLTQETINLIEEACEDYHLHFEENNPQESLKKLLELLTNVFTIDEYNEFIEWKQNQ